MHRVQFEPMRHLVVISVPTLPHSRKVHDNGSLPLPTGHQAHHATGQTPDRMSFPRPLKELLLRLAYHCHRRCPWFVERA